MGEVVSDAVRRMWIEMWKDDARQRHERTEETMGEFPTAFSVAVELVNKARGYGIPALTLLNEIFEVERRLLEHVTTNGATKDA